MIKAFLEDSTWQDLVQYMVIAIVVVALSPYGAFIVRYCHAVATGGPRPRLVRASLDAGAARHGGREWEELAYDRIRDLETRAVELEANVSEAEREIVRLEDENAALRDRIREMDTGSGQRDTGRGTGAPDHPDDQEAADLDLLGLTRSPSLPELKAAYRGAVRRHHPDHGGDGEMLQRINAAYERLRRRHAR